MTSIGTRADRVILVIGSSFGIGKACCERLARSGRSRVYGASRTHKAATGWIHLPMDVTDEASVAIAVAEIMEREGRIDALVHCAGNGLAGPVEETSVEEAQRQFDTNYFGAVRALRAVLPVMRQQAHGQIIMIGSIGGLIGLPFVAHYSASKFALDGLVEALRSEVEPFGIEATVLHPGDFNTSFGGNRIHCAAAKAGSPYYARFIDRVAFYAAAENNGGPPDVVARKVERLLQRRRLPARVLVGSALEVAGVWAKALLPSRGFDYIFRKAYGP